MLAILVSPKVSQNDSLLITLDKSALLQINNSHFLVLNELMILLTEYGREVVWASTIILFFIFGGRTGTKTAIVMTIVILVLIPVGVVAKDIVARPRPIIPMSDFLIAADSDFAFPSGHALIVSAGSAVAFVLYSGSYKKRVVSIVLTIEAAFVCISRVYVGGHYPLDVLGGILLGVGVAFIFIGFEKKIDIMIQPIMKALKLQ